MKNKSLTFVAVLIAVLMTIGISIANESLSNANESLSNANESLSNANESLSNANESLNNANESLNIVNESLNIVNESSNIVNESSNIVNESLNIANESLNIANESLNVANESSNNESLSNVTESLNIANKNLYIVKETQKKINVNYAFPKIDIKKQENFQAKYGTGWNIIWNEKTGKPGKIYGSGIDPEANKMGIKKISKDNIDTLSKNFINNNKDLFEVGSSDMILKKADYDVPLHAEHNDGSWYVYYQQQYKDIPVHGSSLGLILINGKIVQISSNTYPDISISTTPKISNNKAREIAEKELNVSFTAITSPEYVRPGILERKTGYGEKFENASLVIFPKVNEKNGGMEYHLAWEVKAPLIRKPLSAWNLYIDAVTGEILYKEDRIRYADASGTVTGRIYPQNPLQSQVDVYFNHEYVDVYKGIEVTTSSSGYYSATLPTNIDVWSGLVSDYIWVLNYSGQNYYFYTSVPTGSTVSWNWKDYDLSYKKEQSNVFYHGNKIHDYYTSGSPFNIPGLDYMYAYIEVPGSCNAYADGYSINFYGPGGGCDSTALGAAIIYHEYTHNVVDRVISFDYPYVGETGALNEAWADYFATSFLNNPVMGEGVMPSQYVRYMNNTNRYPDDLVGEVHGDSPIISGALWDMRSVLGASLADNLALRAMKLKPYSFSEYLDDLLIVDDNNGNLADGTPDIITICNAFSVKHGIISSYCLNSIFRNYGYYSYTNTTDVSIPDNDGWVYSTITVPPANNKIIKGTMVYVDIPHTWRGDLVVALVYPDGSYTYLKYPNGSDSSDNIARWYITGFNNSPSQGTWGLWAEDIYSLDTGYINSWTLRTYFAGKQEIAIFRPSSGIWYIDSNRNGAWNPGIDVQLGPYGTTGDVPVAIDWDGDGRQEIAIFRPSSGIWYIDSNRNGGWNPGIDVQLGPYGMTGDVPVAIDWDGDGRQEIAVFRPSSGIWYIDSNHNGAWNPGIDVQLGPYGTSPGDVPVAIDWNGDGKQEIAVFRPSSGIWYIDSNHNGAWNPGIDVQLGPYGMTGDRPVAIDWDGDGRQEIAVFRPSSGIWYIDSNRNGAWNPGIDVQLGPYGTSPGDVPVAIDWDGSIT